MCTLHRSSLSKYISTKETFPLQVLHIIRIGLADVILHLSFYFLLLQKLQHIHLCSIVGNKTALKADCNIP